MRKRPRLLLALALVVFAQTTAAVAQERPDPSAQPAAWTRYTYPREEFSAEMPAMPAVFHTSRSVNNSIYESERMRVFGLYSEGVVYMIAAYDEPRSSESSDFFARYIWGGRGMTPKGDVSLGEFRGREYDVGLGFHGTARVFRAKKRAYLFMAFSNEEGHRAAVERFFGSLTLGAKPAGERIADDKPSKPFVPPSAQPRPQEPLGVGRGESVAPASPAPASPPEGPFRQAEVARKAVIVYKPEPGFTGEARRENVTGVVRLRAVLSSTGKVTNVRVVKWLPAGLTDNAIKAARHILFFPARKDGRPVSQYVVLEYNFNIY